MAERKPGDRVSIGSTPTCSFHRWALCQDMNPSASTPRIMSPTGTPQLTERLPLELLEKVLANVSVPDILRMKQVGRVSDPVQRSSSIFWMSSPCQVARDIHHFIQGSPYIQHRIDLFAAGLVDNPASNFTLADKRRAFEEYRMKWDTFNPVKKLEREVDNLYFNHQASGSGTYCFVAGSQKFIEFVTLESVSRGIPRKEWKLPHPEFRLSGFAINPHADVLVIVEKNARSSFQHWKVASRAD